MEFKNKTAIITGGCGQVGFALSKMLGTMGCRVVALCRKDIEQNNQKMQTISSDCIALYADVTQSSTLKSIANKIGHCDILINAAGYTKNILPGKLNELTDDIFNLIVQTNLGGVFYSIREFVPIIKNGVIVNISSTSGLRASQSNLAYGASKAGIDLITKTLAKNLAPNIRVVGIAPGFLENPTSGAIKAPGANDRIKELTPLKRIGQAEDIAEIVLSVITNRHITGQTITVDGGISL